MSELTPYLADRIERGPDCWPWLGSVDAVSGYGVANIPGRRTGAHRAVYELLVGPIPGGLTLDHQCHNRDRFCKGGRSCLHRRCVNPAHLEPVSRGENSRRGRGTPAVNLTKKRCPKGHEYDWVDPRGWRKCSICVREKATARLRAAGVKPTRKGTPDCKHGHPYTPENTRWSNGKRHCKECDRLNLRRWQEKARKPCRGCGGPKPPGKARAYCEKCLPVKARPRSSGPSPEVVDAVYDRASHSCEKCKAAVGPIRGTDHHIHHRRPRAAGGSKRADTNSPANLLLLCPPCHEGVESRRTEALECGWLVPQGCDPASVAVLILRDRWLYLTPSGTYSTEPPKETP